VRGRSFAGELNEHEQNNIEEAFHLGLNRKIPLETLLTRELILIFISGCLIKFGIGPEKNAPQIKTVHLLLLILQSASNLRDIKNKRTESFHHINF